MKRIVPMARRAAGALAVALAFAALLAVASRVVAPKNNQSEFGQIDAAANGIMGEPRDSIDVLFIGDSESFSSFSPLQLWGERGMTSYVCGTPAQRLPYTRTLLARALKAQSPRVVVLETNCIFAPFDAVGAAKRAVQDAFPVFEYHDRWKHLTFEDLFAPVRHTWTDDLKGFRLNHAKEVSAADASSHMAQTEAMESLSLLNRLYLEEIARMCRERGAALMLVSTPSTKNWNMARHNRIVQMAGALDVPYVDLNVGSDKVAIDWARDTYDAGDHLNLAGAQKVTAAMGALLAERYGIADHRGDAAYASWDDACARYRQRLAAL